MSFEDEGVYVDTSGKLTKNVILQWGERPLSVANVSSTGQILGWGEKAIEIRSAETGHLDGVFMHEKKALKFRFLCERNDKVTGFLRVFSDIAKYTSVGYFSLGVFCGIDMILLI